MLRIGRIQITLLVLIGDDSGLSAPITFESITGQSPPVEQEDAVSIGH